MSPHWRLPRPRFSLLTLLLGVVFIGACYGLRWRYRYDPWVRELVLRGQVKERKEIAVEVPGAAWTWVDGKEGKEVFAPLTRGHYDDREDLAAFSPDGSRIATVLAAEDGPVTQIWDAATGKERAELRTRAGAILAVVFSSDGLRVVTACLDGGVREWDANSGQQRVLLEWSRSSPSCAAFSPDATRIAIPTDFGALIRVLSVADVKENAVLEQSAGSFRFIGFSVDGRQIAAMEYGDLGYLRPEPRSQYAVRVWATETGQQRAVLKGHLDVVCAAVFSPDGQRVVTGSFDDTARLWNVETGTQLGFLQYGDAGSAIRSVAYSPDGQRIAISKEDGTAGVFDAPTMRAVAVLEGHSGHVRATAFSPDGKRLVTVSADGAVFVWLRTRPEYWWGIAWLPEFWVAYVAGGALLVITARNLRRLFAKSAAVPPAPNGAGRQ